MSLDAYASAIRTRGTGRDSLIQQLLHDGIAVYTSGIHPDTHGRFWDGKNDPQLRTDTLQYATARVIVIDSNVL